MQLEQTKQMTLKEKVETAFQARYGEAPSVVVRAPGRVNLLGAYTGYNGGYVLSFAVDRYTMIALRARDDGQMAIQTLDNDEVKFDMEQFEKTDDFSDLIKGTAWALGSEGFSVRGWEGVIGSDIPAGMDLAAEASVMMATMRAFAEVSGFSFAPQPIANTADKAYTDFVGKRSILPDLYAIGLAQPAQAILLDTKSLDIDTIDLSREAQVVLLDTGKRQDNHTLEAIITERAEHHATAARNYKVGHLRDLSMTRFDKDSESLEEIVEKHARHFLTENGRTILGGEMMRSGALATIGKMMLDSHTSLRNEYGVHNDAADQMIACVMEQPNVFGARWTGIGGGVLALIRDFSADTASKLALSCYKKATGYESDAIILNSVGSVEQL